jgi:hypothetical protein
MYRITDKSTEQKDKQMTTKDASVVYNAQNLPPIVNHRYQWKPSAPDLKPSESNPDFSIRGYS